VIALGSAAVTANVGLSIALGAFPAGLLIGETEFPHQIKIDISQSSGSSPSGRPIFM
jgi:monovalent cation:H+ antiporter-2, CPA2 family